MRKLFRFSANLKSNVTVDTRMNLPGIFTTTDNIVDSLRRLDSSNDQI